MRMMVNILRNAVFACAAPFFLCSCVVDSVQPWLESDSVMPRELDFEGGWTLVDPDTRDKYAVTLRKDRDARSIDQQKYYIQISPNGFDSRFNFIGVIHKVNGIKLLQISNFSHYHDEVFSLANRPTVSLWQIAYDENNIVIWPPAFLLDDVSALKTMRDSDDKLLFVDTTENLRAYIEDWTKNYSEKGNNAEYILPVILTRSGTEFRMPDEMHDLVPRVYKRSVEAGG